MRLKNRIGNKSNSSRKQIDELAERLAGWNVNGGSKGRDMSTSSENKNNNEIEEEKEKEMRIRIARLRDPRRRYFAEKLETWAHPSNLRESCRCEGCLSSVDPCNFGCRLECVPGCVYYASEGLETLEGVVAHKGTEAYERLLEEWRDYCRRVNARKRFKR